MPDKYNHPRLPAIPDDGSKYIKSIDFGAQQYLQLRDQIKAVIKFEPGDKYAVVEDILDAFSKLDDTPTWLSLLSLGIKPLKNWMKRQRLRTVIENILRKIFDVTLDWYAMDYEDVKETCDSFAGKDYFSRDDHRHMYVAVIQKLKEGPLRDRCIEKGVVNFLNDKLTSIRDNFIQFKKNEL